MTVENVPCGLDETSAAAISASLLDTRGSLACQLLCPANRSRGCQAAIGRRGAQVSGKAGTMGMQQLARAPRRDPEGCKAAVDVAKKTLLVPGSICQSGRVYRRSSMGAGRGCRWCGGCLESLPPPPLTCRADVNPGQPKAAARVIPFPSPRGASRSGTAETGSIKHGRSRSRQAHSSTSPLHRRTRQQAIDRTIHYSDHALPSSSTHEWASPPESQGLAMSEPFLCHPASLKWMPP